MRTRNRAGVAREASIAHKCGFSPPIYGYYLGRAMQIDTHTLRGATVLTAIGELDSASGPALRAAAQEACTSPQAEVVLDLRGVTFMDSSGVRALVQIANRYRDIGATVRLVANRKLAQKFALTGIGEAISWTEEMPEISGEQ